MPPRKALKHILDSRICDLGLRLENSRFAPLIKQVKAELRATGIRLSPRFYLSTEYGCIVRSTTIGLLWTDGFPTLQALARRFGIRTRTEHKLLRTLRHEIGHAFCYAHRLYRSREYRRIFNVRGRYFASYPEIWKPKARDRERLKNGEFLLLYAARHPDEDFAICFQTWLYDVAHDVDWGRRYRNHPRILEKLHYVDQIVRHVGTKTPSLRPVPLHRPIERLRVPVEKWMHHVLKGTNYNLMANSPVA